jgi:uncharacterized protein YkwD
MQKSFLSLVAIGFLVASCGGGSSSTATTNTSTDSTSNQSNTTTNSSDNTQSSNTTSSSSDNTSSLTGDGEQNSIDTSVEVSPSNYAVPAISETDKERFLTAINNARAVSRDCGDGQGVLPAANPLTWNDKLYAAAYEHNYDMVNADYFDHYGSKTQYDITGSTLGKNSTPFDRIKANGYIDGASGYGMGENLAAGQSTIEDAVSNAATNWLDSPPHCANLMNADFTEMGLSKVKSPINGQYYWTHTLGYTK